jgi:hypothetical protein
MRAITSIAQLRMIPGDPVRHPHPRLPAACQLVQLPPLAAQQVSQVCDGVQHVLTATLDDRAARADW